MPTCPNGHQSVAEDWCEVCGHRILAPAAAAVPPPPPPPGFPQQPGLGPMPGPGGHLGPGGGPPELCPQCHTPREDRDAPFCEQCRFNFLTNSPTTYIPPAPHGPGPGPGHAPPPMGGPGGPGGPGGGYPGGPGPGPGGPGPGPGPGQPMYPHQPHPPHPAQQSGDWVISPPGAPPGGVPPQPGPGGPGGYPGPGGPPGTWMVSIGADPQYFQAMMRRSGPEASQLQLPPYSPEQQLPLNKPQITIGRRRQSTGETPDIDLARAPEDPGVSHQHAILVQQPDGSWAVVDQDSTNGTTVNGGDEPIQPFVPVPLNEGDRVHIGAWTTLTLYRG
ncbi:FHA domain-containing protein [Streptomyces sp. 4N509B]|uniref:FHA domain-containing protein n=1 Tax=Streptomyces sp. 4N509B TaxID=3457413 RepID=UPI003FD1D4BD